MKSYPYNSPVLSSHSNSNFNNISSNNSSSSNYSNTNADSYNQSITFKEVAVEKQHNNNCGPEVIENLVLYLVGYRFDQDEAVANHSELFTNSSLLTDSNTYEVEQGIHVITLL
jgi:hypothetical protein